MFYPQTSVVLLQVSDTQAAKAAATPGLGQQTVAEQRWALKRKHALLSADLELLSFEVRELPTNFA